MTEVELAGILLKVSALVFPKMYREVEKLKGWAVWFGENY